MLRAILTGIFVVLGTIFVIGTFGCIFFLGLAALDLFLKCMVPFAILLLIFAFVIFLAIEI